VLPGGLADALERLVGTRALPIDDERVNHARWCPV
jgi:hypothetical protein